MPLDLLLLRTFGARQRSEQLLEGLSLPWRYMGNIHLIAGGDLATVSLEPDELFCYGDTWRLVLVGLAKRVNVVVMDLRRSQLPRPLASLSSPPQWRPEPKPFFWTDPGPVVDFPETCG